MDKWLCDNGVAVWLLPTIFLQARYGEALREYLLNKVQLLRLHIYDDQKLQFDNADISTTIVVFKKRAPDDSLDIRVSYGGTAKRPSTKTVLRHIQLVEAVGNWRRLVHFPNQNALFEILKEKNLKFKDVFNIKRGLATGANSFFVMERSEARARGIPDIALKPLLPKARSLKHFIVNRNEDGYPDVDTQLVLIDCDIDEGTIKKLYPEFHDYLLEGKRTKVKDKFIPEKTLVKSRHPWYKQEVREIPPFLLTYMGRNKNDRPPLYFILNKSDALALNTYLLLYPKAWVKNLLEKNNKLYELILSALNHTAEKIIIQQTRIYSGGLQKLEPGELRDLPIIDLPESIVTAFDNVGFLGADE